MTEPLAAAHVALSAIILLWDILMAGRIAQVRTLPRPFAALAAAAGLLIAPALVVNVATGSMLYGRAIQTIAWLWSATLVLFAVQALYALVGRLVTPLFGIPLALYNTILAAVAVTRFAITRGIEPPALALDLVAAHASALAAIVGSSALHSPAVLLLPVLAPGFRARWRTSAAVRVGMAAVAAAWTALIVAEVPLAGRAVDSYSAYATDRLQERPEGGFSIGLRLFPELAGGPSPLAVRRDLAAADSIGADVLSIVLQPAGTDRATLDSLRRTLDERRRAGARLMVTLGYDHRLWERFRHPRPFDPEARLDALERIARRLEPEILVPALEPYGRGARIHGRLRPALWMKHLSDAARLASAVSRRIRLAVAASTYGPADSALHAWAASEASPMHIVGFTLLPSRFGARGMDAQMQAAERWMARSKSAKPHWVIAAAAFPTTHGERSQELSVRGVLAWATSRAEIQGVVFVGAADYDRSVGLRAPDGRLRPAALEVARAVRALREREAPPIETEEP